MVTWFNIHFPVLKLIGDRLKSINTNESHFENYKIARKVASYFGELITAEFLWIFTIRIVDISLLMNNKFWVTY